MPKSSKRRCRVRQEQQRRGIRGLALRRTVRRVFLIVVLAAGCAISGCGAKDPSAAASSRFAPYVDVSLSTSSLQKLVKQSGTRQLVPGFVIAANRSCRAEWGGGVSLANQNVANVARDTTVSFGGKDGPDLARRCPDATALAGQYEQVLSRLRATGADFDIEGAAVRDGSSVERRSVAMAALQAWAQKLGRRLSISLTLPVDPSGLPGSALNVIRSAVAAGVHVGRVNLLAMDFGTDEPATTPGRMADYVTAAARHAADQLRPVLPGTSATSIWRTLGITTMIGRNDVRSEIFTTRDASKVLQFARTHGIGWLSFWSLSRDRSCPSGVATAVAHDTCSGISQPPFRFTSLFAGYRG